MSNAPKREHAYRCAHALERVLAEIHYGVDRRGLRKGGAQCEEVPVS
jgi:hypothetical protein